MSATQESLFSEPTPTEVDAEPTADAAEVAPVPEQPQLDTKPSSEWRDILDASRSNVPKPVVSRVTLDHAIERRRDALNKQIENQTSDKL